MEGEVRHSNGTGRGVNQLPQSQPQAAHYVFETQEGQAQLHGLPQLKIPAGLGGMERYDGAKAESYWAGGAAGAPHSSPRTHSLLEPLLNGQRQPQAALTTSTVTTIQTKQAPRHI